MTEPRLAAALIRLNADLRAIGARWALIGGLAVSARAEPRTTRDRDALDLISRRGFNRKKNLEAELEEQLRQVREQQRARGS